MCLAVPGKLIKTIHREGLSMGQFDFGGVLREACLIYLPELKVGEYALIHVGFAISRIDEDAAQQTLADLAQMSNLVEQAHE